MKNGIYFLHIPKCAGTTFRAWIENNYYKDDAIGFWDDISVIKTPPSVLKSKHCISSHSGWGLMEHLADTHRVVTVLRDPIERTISSYRFIQQITGHALNKLAHSVDTLEFFQHPTVRRCMANGQTRQLAFSSMKNTIEIQSLTGTLMQHDHEKKLIDDFDKNMLQTAIGSISKVDFLGTSENINQLVLSMCDFYGWYPPNNLPKLNVTHAEFTANVTSEVIEEIKSINEKDIILYEKFARDGVSGKTTPLQRNEVIRKFEVAMQSATPRSDFRFDFESPLSGEGWYGREQEHGGWIVRWTGPEASSSLYLRLDPSINHAITLMASSYLHEIMDGIEIFANDRKLNMSFIQLESPAGCKRVIKTAIDSTVLSTRDGLLEFRIQLPYTMIPHELSSTDPDRRALGIYVHWLDFTRA
ncbi:sulfotransferase family 2 domain-containing protein [Azospirillum tabaci]|uniref:sulfotransferase family 2 domain-containing protein n=1 Tax=Azospirillum tabaci TaxID=2752310 RepID=UPI0016602805|nr:sulfotransferase family 2 domain-containing protein [Azospirillum tabaci]